MILYRATSGKAKLGEYERRHCVTKAEKDHDLSETMGPFGKDTLDPKSRTHDMTNAEKSGQDRTTDCDVSRASAETSAHDPALMPSAGISGLLLAQSLSRHGIPFRVFERDTDLETRGVGWGLTLLWTLPALKALLPKPLFDRLPEAYVDREAVTQGLSSSFPFFELSTGELKASVPKAPEAERVRVTRQGLRVLLATGIDIEWSKAVTGVVSTDDSVTASFEDGSSVTGSLLVACDGSHSRVRRSLFPEWKLQDIPVRMLGIKMELSPSQIKPIRDLDPYFFHSTNSRNDTFIYFSVLDAPGNHADTSRPYIGQLCVSWPYREGFLNRPSPIEIPETPEEKYKLVQELTLTWAGCFRPLASAVSLDSEMKGLKIQDLTPPTDFQTAGRAVLMGDALHAMAMCKTHLSFFVYL
uniref:FAD-binding domain-containing protein n=1 Tax=Fusarium oxysporum (strain Fo5176) TaxID=660025 RepID=A0A0D2YA53_FUSOF